MKPKNDPIGLVEQIKRLAAEPKSRLKFSQIRVIVAIERVIARLEAEPRVRALRATLMPLRLTSTRKNRWS
ncbi:hypothetical protein WDW37_00090 [Bdellovibrionota bacterium FG-1]